MKFLGRLVQSTGFAIGVVALNCLVSRPLMAQRNFTDHMDWRGVDLTIKPGQVVSLFHELDFGTGISGECGRDLNGVELKINNKAAKPGQITLYSNHRQMESWQRVVAKRSSTYDLPLRWNNTFCHELADLELVNDGAAPIHLQMVRFRLGRGFVRGLAETDGKPDLKPVPAADAFFRTVNGRR